MRFGRGHSIMRFGRAGHSIMHFGKRAGDASPLLANDESGSSSSGYLFAPDYPVPVLDQAVLDAVYVNPVDVKRSSHPLVPRLLLPHLFLTNFYNNNPSRARSSHPLSRSRSNSLNYNKKASDSRDLRERDNVFMHFG